MSWRGVMSHPVRRHSRCPSLATHDVVGAPIVTAEQFWIGDNPRVAAAALEHLRKQIGSPLCDACVAHAIHESVSDVRRVLARLAANNRCEQGLWWCGACSTKAYVTIVLAAHT